jgi:hypothetical protein
VIVAHIFGLPIEETAPQLAQAGFIALIALQLIRGRMRRFFRRGRRSS